MRRLSIIVPTLNAAAVLPVTLESLQQTVEAVPETGNPDTFVTVVDGGSTDGTREIAARFGCEVVTSPPGRGVQLARGAEATPGDWYFFVHADTRMEPGWCDCVVSAMHPEQAGVAGYFRFALDDASAEAERLERVVDWRCRTFGLPYGDQGLVISRALYEEVGGYRPIPLMEDVDIIRRIGRRRLTYFKSCAAVTSAERYRRDGYLLRSTRNLACLGLYFAGVPPRWIKRLYG